MALKDLTVQKAKLTEEVIEAIISDYVRYDIEEREVAFMPEATGLSSKAKVLVFLVAQQGWQFVQDEVTDVEVAPAQLTEFLGIQGGTLRPILKDLKDRNILAVKSGKYSVRSTSLDAIKAELDGNSRPTPRRQKRIGKRRTTQLAGDSDSSIDKVLVPKKAPGKKTTSSTRFGQKPGEAFNRIVVEGFFNDGRTLAQVLQRLHQHAVIIKQTSLPKYLLSAVRDGRLTREKRDVEGRTVWVYTSTN